MYKAKRSRKCGAFLQAFLPVSTQKLTFWSRIRPFSLDPNVCGMAFPFTSKTSVCSMGKEYFCMLFFFSSSLFVFWLVECFPLTSLFQTISSRALKGNSESDVMLTTTCIACISFINDFFRVSKTSVIF